MEYLILLGFGFIFFLWFMVKCMESVSQDKKEKTKMLEKKVIITESKFEEYVRVQVQGLYNMYDPKARALSYLSQDEWLEIMKNYNRYSTLYPDVRKAYGYND